MTAGQPVDPSPPLREALQRLVDDFDLIEVWPSETGGKDPVADERARTMLEVAAIAGFMEAVPELKGKERRLVTLLSALHDVHEGRYPKLLKPKPKGKRGKKKPALSKQFCRARAAAAMEFFMRAGYGKDKAAQCVANGCARWFDKRPLSRTVARWRDAVMGAAEAAEGDDARYYRETIALLEVFCPDPEQAARHLLST